jgi:hypothetical protein
MVTIQFVADDGGDKALLAFFQAKIEYLELEPCLWILFNEVVRMKHVGMFDVLGLAYLCRCCDERIVLPGYAR